MAVKVSNAYTLETNGNKNYDIQIDGYEQGRKSTVQSKSGKTMEGIPKFEVPGATATIV